MFGCLLTYSYLCTQKVNVEDNDYGERSMIKISFRAPEKRVWAYILCYHRFKVLFWLTKFFIIRGSRTFAGKRALKREGSLYFIIFLTSGK